MMGLGDAMGSAGHAIYLVNVKDVEGAEKSFQKVQGRVSEMLPAEGGDAMLLQKRLWSRGTAAVVAAHVAANPPSAEFLKHAEAGKAAVETALQLLKEGKTEMWARDAPMAAAEFLPRAETGKAALGTVLQLFYEGQTAVEARDAPKPTPRTLYITQLTPCSGYTVYHEDLRNFVA